VNGNGDAVGADAFRNTLRRHASGVVVVTGGDVARPSGFTVTSFTSVSLTPPLVSFCARTTSAAWAALEHQYHFVVNMLAADQEETAHRFAQRGVDRFASPTEWSCGVYGVPFVKGAIAYLTCARQTALPVGDHMLVVGLVTDTVLGSDDPPLVRHKGCFHSLRRHTERSGQP
jgi:flavin reductase (DIM6/NTAB) family NADH-FMN oxidoreductase RutF